MIERLARASCVYDGLDPDRVFTKTEANGRVHSETQWEHEIGLIRVLLEAMREPTEEMLAAVYGKELSVGITEMLRAANPSMRLHYSVAFEAMIDAALANPSPTDRGGGMGEKHDPRDEVCECGDYRSDHPNDGPCLHNKPNDLCHGYRDCVKFRPTGTFNVRERESPS